MDITKNSSAIMVLHWIISNGAIQTLKRWEQENFFPKKRGNSQSGNFAGEFVSSGKFPR